MSDRDIRALIRSGEATRVQLARHGLVRVREWDGYGYGNGSGDGYGDGDGADVVS